MDPDLLFWLTSTFFVFLFISVFFASAEIALLSLSAVEMKELSKKSTRNSKRISLLLGNPHSLFIAIRFALLITQILLVSTVIFFSQSIADMLQLSNALTLTVLLGVFAFLLFTINEIWVKVIVLKNNVAFAELVSLPIKLYFNLAKPFVGRLSHFLRYLSIKFDVSRKNAVFEHHKIMAMVENKEENGSLEASEREMIDSVIEFGEMEVHEVMIPRIDIVCVEENISVKDLMTVIKRKGHSRIPLYENGLDNILGIIYAKDLLPTIINGKTVKPDLKELARPAYFVPKSKKLHHLLREFQKEQQHMAIVVDEYGGTAGLITLEDVLEEIVGDIQDEYDKEPPLFKKVDDSNFLINAKIDLNDLNEELKTDLPTEGDYESLGGFIFSLTGYVPAENEIVRFKNYEFRINKVVRNRIVKVKMTKGVSVEGGEKVSEDK